MKGSSGKTVDSIHVDAESIWIHEVFFWVALPLLFLRSVMLLCDETITRQQPCQISGALLGNAGVLHSPLNRMTPFEAVCQSKSAVGSKPYPMDVKPSGPRWSKPSNRLWFMRILPVLNEKGQREHIMNLFHPQPGNFRRILRIFYQPASIIKISHSLIWWLFYRCGSMRPSTM